MPRPLQVLRRSLVAIAALALALAVLPAGALTAPFGVTKLRQGSSAGAEDYAFTDGNVVFAQGTVDAGSHYRFCTRVRLRISRRLARRIFAGLRQRPRVTVRLTGVADHSGAASQTVRLRIRLRR